MFNWLLVKLGFYRRWVIRKGDTTLTWMTNSKAPTVDHEIEAQVEEFTKEGWLLVEKP